MHIHIYSMGNVLLLVAAHMRYITTEVPQSRECKLQCCVNYSIVDSGVYY